LALSKLKEAKKTSIKEFVEEAKETLLKAGFTAQNITTRVVEKKSV